MRVDLKDHEDFRHVGGKGIGRLDRHDLKAAELAHHHFLAMGRHDALKQSLRRPVFKRSTLIGGRCWDEGVGEGRRNQDGEKERQESDAFHSPPF